MLQNLKTLIRNECFGLKISWKASHPLFIFKLLYSFIVVLFPIAISYVWKDLINNLTEQGLLATTIILTAAYIIFKIFSYLMGVVNDYLVIRYYDARSFYIDNIIIKKLSRVDLAYFDSSSMADRVGRIKSNMGMLHDAAWQVFDIITEIINVIVNALLLSFINPICGILNILLLVPSFVSNQKYLKKMYSQSLSQARDNRLMNYYKDSISNINNQSEIKLNHFTSYFLNQSDKIWKRLFDSNRHLEVKQAKSQILYSILGTLGPIITLLVSVNQALTGNIGLGDVQFYLNISNTLQNQVNSLFRDTNSFLINNIKIDELRKFIDEQPKHEKSGALKLTAAPKIEFKDVTFAYPNSSENVLNSCSFVIQPDEKIALIGLNGAGKSTIIKLLFGFYSPSGGVITLNDIDINEYDIYSVRKVFGVLFQNYVEYCLPLREIIALPCFDERFNEKRLDEAASITGFKNVINKWETGYDTILGRYYASNGKDLSGGQWQLLCLTRAYFQNAPMMILDEPSASLDPISEQKIFNQLYDLSYGKGSIVITHQLSNIKFSNRILLLDKGRIAETGTHDQLIKMDGLYSKLYYLQASKYK